MRKTRERLSKQAWSRAALEVIVSGGVAAVSVERLATSLGVTKGSFYWHFDDRAALIEAALARWEQLGTTDIIDALGSTTDPRRRLAKLLSISFGGAHEGSLEAALVGQSSDPMVRPAVARVSTARVAFLEQIFAELGFTPAQSRARAIAAYSMYVGHLQLLQATPGVIGDGRATRRHTRRILALLTAPPA